MWFEGKWIQLKDIMLHDVNQAQKYTFFSHTQKVDPKDKHAQKQS
jgi:hypothetical protein